MRKYKVVSMNNSFSGHCLGIHLGIRKGRIPSNENGVKHKWVIYEWCYFGNGRDKSPEGSYLSPVLDEG